MKVELEDRSLAYVISAIYLYVNNIDMYAIPSELFIIVAEELSKYIDDWDYNAKSIEDWIREDLIIYPQELMDFYFAKDDYKDNPICIEYNNGSVVIVATAGVYLK